jgi:hypothetical protein
MRTHVTITLVVREDEEDVRAVGGMDDEREQQASEESHRGGPTVAFAEPLPKAICGAGQRPAAVLE